MHAIILYFTAFQIGCAWALARFFWLRGYPGAPSILIGIVSIPITSGIPLAVLLCLDLLASQVSIKGNQISDAWLLPSALFAAFSVVRILLHRWSRYWPLEHSTAKAPNKAA